MFKKKKKKPQILYCYLLLLPHLSLSQTNFLGKLTLQNISTSSLHLQLLPPGTYNPQILISAVFPVPQDVSDHCLFSSLLPRVSHGFSPIPLRPFFSHLCQLVFLCLGLLIVLVPQASSCAQVSLPLAISLGKFICSQCLLYTNSMLITLKRIFWLQFCLSASSIHEIADWRLSCLLVWVTLLEGLVSQGGDKILGKLEISRGDAGSISELVGPGKRFRVSV